MRAINKFPESMANKVGVFLAKPGKVIGFSEFDEVRSLRTVKRVDAMEEKTQVKLRVVFFF